MVRQSLSPGGLKRPAMESPLPSPDPLPPQNLSLCLDIGPGVPKAVESVIRNGLHAWLQTLPMVSPLLLLNYFHFDGERHLMMGEPEPLSTDVVRDIGELGKERPGPELLNLGQILRAWTSSEGVHKILSAGKATLETDSPIFRLLLIVARQEDPFLCDEDTLEKAVKACPHHLFIQVLHIHQGEEDPSNRTFLEKFVTPNGSLLSLAAPTKTTKAQDNFARLLGNSLVKLLGHPSVSFSAFRVPKEELPSSGEDEKAESSQAEIEPSVIPTTPLQAKTGTPSQVSMRRNTRSQAKKLATASAQTEGSASKRRKEEGTGKCPDNPAMAEQRRKILARII